MSDSKEDNDVPMEYENGEGDQQNPKKRKSFNSVDDVDSKRRKRKEQEQDRKAKKMRNPKVALADSARQLWEQFSQRAIDKEKRYELMDEFVELTKGRMLEIIFKNNASRFFQTVIKWGLARHTQVIFDDLKDHVLELAKNHYAHHILIKLIKWGSKEQKDFILKAFYGHVTKLAKHKDAAPVLEKLYTEYATKHQRAALIEEFYGAEFALFKSDNIRTLDDILAENPQKKPVVLRYLKDNVLAVLNKAEKSSLLSHSILHPVLLGYMKLIDGSERAEFISNISEHLIRVIHSKEGSQVGWQCVSYGSAKDRKAIIKSFKSHVARISLGEFSHFVFMRLLDVTDDTVLITKTFMPELKKDLLNLAKDKNGRLVLLHLLSPRNRRYLSEATIEQLQPAFLPDPENPSNQIPTSKKDPETRRQELLKAIWAELKELALQRTFTTMCDRYARDVLFETIHVAQNDEKEALYDAVLSLVDYSDEVEKEKNKYAEKKKFHALDFLREEDPKKEDIMVHSLAHRTVRRLVESDAAFASKLHTKIEGKLLHYTKTKFSSWVVWGLIECEATRDKVFKALSKSKNELKKVATEQDQALQLIVKFLNNPKDKQVFQAKHDE